MLLISLDTTRADDLSCYGDSAASTPILDGLAARGLRFERALAHAPTTLSSHTSLFSGQDAHGTGVVRNGTPVPPELPLLAERLQAAGWDTAAVIGASVLAAKWGLGRGFRVYDDDVGENRVRRRFEDDAPGVTARALAAADGRLPDRPLFLFVHYFDVHMPWDSAPPELQARFLGPEPHTVKPRAAVIRRMSMLGRMGALPERDRAQARGLHLAEVAWVDQHIGALLAGLEARGLMQNSLVVALSDHGESLGEPGSSEVFGHGLDVDGPNIHVPLIMAGAGALATPAGRTVARQVRLMDVGATLSAMVGLGGGLGQGEDLTPLWLSAPSDQRPAPPSFAEASKPSPLERKDAWNNLPFERSVAADGLLYVRAPLQGDQTFLYRAAPGWPALDDPSAAAPLHALLEAWDAAAPPHRDSTMDARTSEMLEALGYLEREP